MARRYIWWQKPEQMDAYPMRVIAQVMRYAAGGEGGKVKSDHALLERELGQKVLRYVIENAEAGWFPEHAWRHWHCYLGIAQGAEIPPLPKRQSMKASFNAW